MTFFNLKVAYYRLLSRRPCAPCTVNDSNGIPAGNQRCLRVYMLFKMHSWPRIRRKNVSLGTKLCIKFIKILFYKGKTKCSDLRCSACRVWRIWKTLQVFDYYHHRWDSHMIQYVRFLGFLCFEHQSWENWKQNNGKSRYTHNTDMIGISKLILFWKKNYMRRTCERY